MVEIVKALAWPSAVFGIALLFSGQLVRVLGTITAGSSWVCFPSEFSIAIPPWKRSA